MNVAFSFLPIYCILLSYLSRTDWNIKNSRFFHLVSLLGFCLCAYLSIGSIFQGHPATLVDAMSFFALVIVSILCSLPWIVFLLGFHFEAGANWAINLKAMKVTKSYDHAEKAEKERDYSKARELYRQYLDKDPGDAEILRRLGELSVKEGKTEEGVQWLMKAIDQVDREEPMMILAFRTAELLVERTEQRREAVALLEKTRARMKHPAKVEHINRRIALIRDQAGR